MNDLYFNEVLLRGRLTGAVGAPALVDSALLEWRLSVDRPDSAAGSVPDVFPCVTHADRILHSATHWRPGAFIDLHGTLRRHTWTTPGGYRLNSLYVDADKATLLPTR